MSVPGEKLNLLIMRDSGETKRYRVRRTWFYALITILICFPLISALLLWGGYVLWQENMLLSKRAILAEKLNEKYAATVQRLTNLEALLIHDDKLADKLEKNIKSQVKPTQIAENKKNTPAEMAKAVEGSPASTKEDSKTPTAEAEMIALAEVANSDVAKQDSPVKDAQKEKVQTEGESKVIADAKTVEDNAKPKTDATSDQAGAVDETAKPTEQNTENTSKVVYAEEVPVDDVTNDQDGPGHIVVEVVDTGKVLIENVISRMVGANRLRTSLDIRNPGDESITGDITCTLSLASGKTIPLELTPENMSKFKIAKWKKTVFFANMPEGTDTFNAQVLMEVKDDKGELIYQNVFAIEQ